MLMRCYTDFMPTTRPRYMITDTGQVAQALDLALWAWPDAERDAATLRRLIAEGAASLTLQRQAQLAALEKLSSLGVGVDYPDAYLRSLHEEWPA